MLGGTETSSVGKSWTRQIGPLEVARDLLLSLE